MPFRHGAIYIAVLMASLLVASLTMAALQATRYHARSLNEESDYRRCQMAADSGLEWAVAHINSDANWRKNHVHNVDVAPRMLNGVSIRYRLIDGVNDKLDDKSTDPCDLLLTASTAGSTCAWRATLAPAGPAIECLSYATAVKEDFSVKSIYSTDGNVASQKKIDVNNGASLTGNCYAKDGSKGPIYGTTQTLAGNLDIPNWPALDYYIANGTAIDFGLLPNFLGKRLFKGQLLSQTSNTISGTLNAEGIYVIDCKGNDISISESRLQCTLVLINVGGNSCIENSLYWEAPQPNYPALLVQGKIELQLSNSPLYESSAGRNLNPMETPFRGQSDNNTSTVYPCLIRGLVYFHDDLEVDSSAANIHLEGCLLARKKLDLSNGSLTVHWRSIFSQDPPPGFGSFSKVRIAKGSVRRVAAP